MTCLKNPLYDFFVIPHTIYDLKCNRAYVNIGVSKDTSEFSCDYIKLWWVSYGQFEYPNCTSILMLADGGGSNSSRHYIFKEDLQNLSDEIGVEIRVAHYPPYTSKCNPVEHRVFPYVTRSLKGVILRSHDYVKELIENTTTLPGLKQILSYANQMGGLAQRRRIISLADHYLELPVSHFSMTAYPKAQEIIEVGYEYTLGKIQKLQLNDR